LGLAFFLLLDETLFFFFADDCAAARGRAETTGAALTRSTAPTMASQFLFLIDSLSEDSPLFFRSRNCTGQKDRVKLVSARAPPDFE
jgi:hypothetical protein